MKLGENLKGETVLYIGHPDEAGKKEKKKGKGRVYVRIPEILNVLHMEKKEKKGKGGQPAGYLSYFYPTVAKLIPFRKEKGEREKREFSFVGIILNNLTFLWALIKDTGRK